MNLNDRMYLLLHGKKPKSSLWIYWSIAGAWFIVGMLAFIALSTGVLGFWSGMPYAWTFAIPVAALAGIFGLVNFIIDRRNGYIKAIHAHYLKRREERINKISAKGK